MNYSKINNSVIKEIIYVNDDKKKEKGIYEYFRNNNTAYYYAKHISQRESTIKISIIKEGDSANAKYIKTLRELFQICKENKIRFLLFKTYKYIDEPVYNDIDIIVKKDDFHLLLEALSKKGYQCEEDEPLKGKCVKYGFSKIEPRVNISFHNFIVFSEKSIWSDIDAVTINSMRILKTSREIDVISLLLNVLYGPNYCKLYLLKILKDTDLKKIENIVTKSPIRKDVELLLEIFNKAEISNYKFPYFLNNIVFFKFWILRIYPNPQMTFFKKIKSLVFFVYIKYRFMFFDSLYFEVKKT